MPMKKILVILLSVFAFVACSKDDYEQFVDSMDDLNNTFWEFKSYRHTDYSGFGTLLRDYVLTTEDLKHYDGSTHSDLYINNNTFYWRRGEPDGRYRIDPCEYNPNTQIIKADIDYEVLEFSRRSIVLRYVVHEAAQTSVVTMYYEPMPNNDKKKEWIEFLNSID